ncbi:tRNA-splicing endonuclease subunit Sen2 [Ceratina calcarata]|uniref:tRNA-splicing endonuclease subunit Sen2 n=1 Tax=Ceratina calcarata TaxID=156304 RepID=A0AAJ7JDT3_9HYME|nr:tRNA-splicing endonuclease subunit Sen2 [Ceratina calcarata]
MELREPKKKRHVRLGNQMPLPIGLGKKEWPVYEAYLTPMGCSVLQQQDMIELNSMGCFGKGSLSRGFPSFGKARYGAPPIIRNRQWICRQEWLRQFNELSMKSVDSEEGICELSQSEIDKDINCLDDPTKESASPPNIIEVETNSATLKKCDKQKEINKEVEIDKEIEIVTANVNSTKENNIEIIEVDECKTDESEEKPVENQDFTFTEDDICFGNSNTSIENKLLVLPDSDSETENYFKEIKPKIEYETCPVLEALNLTFEETFFLLFGLGCLNLYDYSGETLSIDAAWYHFRKMDQNFVQKYVVYHYFRSKGWVVKPGLKYGGDFLLYKQGPSFYHASYIVLIDVLDADTLIRDETKCTPRTWNDLLGLERLSETAAKEILFAQVLWPSSASQSFDLMPVDVIFEFSVKELLWRRVNPKHNKDIEEDDDDSS